MTTNNSWLFYALFSAFFAGLTAILGKLGVSEINSNLATLIRTVIILIMLGAIVTMQGAWEPFNKLSRFGVTMLALSAIATGLSWLCYYRALQLGKASQVAPIDKLSILFVIIISVLFLGEKLTWKLAIGSLLITFGAVIIAL